MKFFYTKTENSLDIKIKDYITKYIKELQRHFDLSDNKIRKILYLTYKELAPYSLSKKYFCMLKSFCNKFKYKDKNEH